MFVEMKAVSFPPLEGNNPKVLILGTIPGIGSINAGEYYHDGSNRIWKLLSRLFGCKMPSTYEEKKELLSRNGLAIWDYYRSVERSDSSDKGIKSGEPNDIRAYLRSHPSIKAIAINGFGKYKLFSKELEAMCNELGTGISVLRLPETSGLNAAWSLDRLAEDWKTILKYV